MHRSRLAVSSRQLAGVLCINRAERGGAVAQRASANANSACIGTCEMPVSKRVVAVDGFEELGTEVWEVGALTDPQVHIVIIPGNPGSAGALSHYFSLYDGSAYYPAHANSSVVLKPLTCCGHWR